jgi:hypothetical protein
VHAMQRLARRPLLLWLEGEKPSANVAGPGSGPDGRQAGAYGQRQSLVCPRQVEGREDGVSCDGRKGRVAERWEEAAQGNALDMAKHRRHCHQ